MEDFILREKITHIGQDAGEVDSPDGRALAEECETMAFSPWNALAEHRLLGGINRLRQAVYLVSQEKRAARTNVANIPDRQRQPS